MSARVTLMMSAKDTGMQAKDIPEGIFLDVVRNGFHKNALGMQLRHVIEAFPGVPEKVVRAKADKLIRRGLLRGCACGCRGDFNVVETFRTPECIADEEDGGPR